MEGGEMESLILKIISTVGFPAAIAFYILASLNPAFQKLTESLNRNTQILSILLAKLDRDDELSELIRTCSENNNNKKKEGEKNRIL